MNLPICKYWKCESSASPNRKFCVYHRVVEQEKCRKYREQNPDKIKKIREARKEYHKEYQKKRLLDPVLRARKNEKDAASKKRRFFRNRAYFFNNRYKSCIQPMELYSLWHQQRGRCVLTGWKLTRDTAHLDHIVPVARGGETIKSNLRYVHNSANVLKSGMLDADLLKLCKAIVGTLEPK